MSMMPAMPLERYDGDSEAATDGAWLREKVAGASEGGDVWYWSDRRESLARWRRHWGGLRLAYSF